MGVAGNGPDADPPRAKAWRVESWCDIVWPTIIDGRSRLPTIVVEANVNVASSYARPDATARGGRVRRGLVSAVVAASLAFSGLVATESALGAPASAAHLESPLAVSPVDAGPAQLSFICPILDRIADRFASFPFVLDIINSLRARFGCISPG